MDAARQVDPEKAPLQTWDEIVAMYPNEVVLMTDVVHGDFGEPWILEARVVGHGADGTLAEESLGCHYPYLTIDYTGERPPLVRPTLILDEETRAILREPLQVIRR